MLLDCNDVVLVFIFSLKRAPHGIACGVTDLLEKSDEGKVKLFFRSFFRLMQEQELSFRERGYAVVFLIRCFQSIETECVRRNCLRLVSLPIWTVLSEGRLEIEFHKKPTLRKLWKAFQRKRSKSGWHHFDSAPF